MSFDSQIAYMMTRHDVYWLHSGF